MLLDLQTNPKDFLVVVLTLMILAPIALAVEVEIPFKLSDDCQNATADIYEILDIKGSTYEGKVITKFSKGDANIFCLRWVSKANPPTSIWDLTTIINGETQDTVFGPEQQTLALPLNEGVKETGRRSILTTSVIDWKENEGEAEEKNLYVSRQEFCLERDQNRNVDIIEQRYKGAGNMPKYVYNPFDNRILDQNSPLYFLPPSFWFPFDAFSFTTERSSSKVDPIASFMFTQIVYVPNEFEPVDLQTIEGEILRKQALVSENTTTGKLTLERRWTFIFPTDDNVYFYKSDNAEEKNVLQLGPVCTTSRKGIDYKAFFKRSSFLIALFAFSTISAAILFILSLIYDKTDRIMEAMLLLFFFQEGVNQLSPLVRPLEVTLFDVAIPILMAITGLVWVLKKLKQKLAIKEKKIPQETINVLKPEKAIELTEKEARDETKKSKTSRKEAPKKKKKN